MLCETVRNVFHAILEFWMPRACPVEFHAGGYNRTVTIL
jgi:hypothetical protein